MKRNKVLRGGFWAARFSLLSLSFLHARTHAHNAYTRFVYVYLYLYYTFMYTYIYIRKQRTIYTCIGITQGQQAYIFARAHTYTRKHARLSVEKRKKNFLPPFFFFFFCILLTHLIFSFTLALQLFSLTAPIIHITRKHSFTPTPSPPRPFLFHSCALYLDSFPFTRPPRHFY